MQSVKEMDQVIVVFSFLRAKGVSYWLLVGQSDIGNAGQAFFWVVIRFIHTQSFALF